MTNMMLVEAIWWDAFNHKPPNETNEEFATNIIYQTEKATLCKRLDEILFRGRTLRLHWTDSKGQAGILTATDALSMINQMFRNLALIANFKVFKDDSMRVDILYHEVNFEEQLYITAKAI